MDSIDQRIRRKDEHTMKNTFKLLYGILIFLAAEAIQLFSIIILKMVYGVYVGFCLGGNASNNNVYRGVIDEAISHNVLYMISTIGVCVCGIAFFFWFKYETNGEFGSNVGCIMNAKPISLLIFMGIGCQFLFNGLVNIFLKYLSKLYIDYKVEMDKLTKGNTVIVILLLVVIAPITEELIFRGVLLHYARKYIKFCGANLFQAFLFGLYHWNILQGLYAAVMGLLLGYICYKFKTVMASIILHVIINASAILVNLFSDYYINYIIFIFAGGAILFITFNRIKKLNLLYAYVTDAK